MANRMSCEEVWSLVSPVLFGSLEKGEEYFEAYIRVFTALSEMEERENGVEGLIEDIKCEVCDHICKYPDIYNDEEEMIEKECSECVLSKLSVNSFAFSI